MGPSWLLNEGCVATPGPSAHLLSRWPLRSIWPWIALLLGVAFSTFLWLRVRLGEQVRLEELHRVQAKAVVDQLKARMAGLEEVLVGAAGYLGRGALPSRAEWRGFVGDHHFASTYPGVQGFSFVAWVPHDRLAAHIRQLQQEGFADYQVLPGGSLPPDPEGFSPVLYLEPMNECNQRAFARDMLRDPTRREAILRARDTGRVSLSGPVTLYQESGTDIQTGVVLLAPVYRQDEPHDTVEQRRRALRGWASYPLRLRDFIQAILSRDLSMMDLELCDGDGSNLSGRLFSSGASQDNPGAATSLAQIIEVAGRTWTVRLQPNARFYAGVGHHEHWEFLAGGLFISLLLFTLLVTVLGAEARARALADQRGEELLAKESQFRMISENVGDMVWVLGLEPFRFEFVSPSVLQLRGLTPEKVIAEPWEEAFTSDSLTRVRSFVAERVPAFRADDPSTWAFTDELEQVRKNGTVFPAEITTRLLPDERGRVVRIIGITRDITDRRKAEDTLRQSESRLRILGDQLPDSFVYQFSMGLDSQPRFLYLSAGVRRLCGLNAEDLIRDAGPLFQQIDPAMLDAYLEAEAASALDLSPFLMDLRMRRADGVWRWFRVRSMPRRQMDGSLVWDGIATDVTLQVANESALLESEGRFRTMVENAGDAIYLNDEEGHVLLCNQAACRSTGYSSEELLRLRIEDIDSGYREARNTEPRRALQAGQLVSIQARHRRKDGSTFPVEVHISLFKEEGPRQFLAVVHDLSEREQIQESELRARKAESLVLMAGGIAHNFNNLFQSIQGNLEIMGLLAGQNASLKLPLDRALGILQRAINLSWKMLDFSGQGFVRREPLDLAAWLPVCLATLRPEFPSTFRLDLICEPVPSIKGDPSKLEQVVQTVLDNALEAASSGTGTVRLRLFTDAGEDRPGPESRGIWPLARPEGPASVCLEFADDGPGVRPEQLNLICDPFYTSKVPGRGLGLPALVGILSAHRAGLHILNGLERGLILRMHFPPEA